MTPSQEAIIEQLSYFSALNSLAKINHLKSREKYAVEIIRSCPGNIFIIKETEDGWWRESHELGKNELARKKQIKKLIDDPSVAYGWIIDRRFSENGGWADPNG